MSQSYPLMWPAGRPRRSYFERKSAPFSSKRANGYRSQLTINKAVERLMIELDRLGVSSEILSTNLLLRLDGLPRSGQGEPADSGVCLYFELKGKEIANLVETRCVWLSIKGGGMPSVLISGDALVTYQGEPSKPEPYEAPAKRKTP